MSEFIFPRAVRHQATLRLKLAALAAVIGLLFALGAGYLGLKYLGYVGNSVTVKVRVTTLGDSLGIGSSVKYRGLRIGRVIKVTDKRAADGTYTVTAVLDPSEAKDVPAQVKARVLPGSIFGAEYIDLESAATPTYSAIRDGDVISADTSAEAVRVMSTLDSAQRILAAVDPATLNESLSQLAGALDGKGASLHRFIEQASELLKQARVHEPALYADLNLLSTNLATSADLEPVLAQAIRAGLPTAAVIAQKAKALEASLKAGTTLTGDLANFTGQHGQSLVDFLAAVDPTYTAFVGGINPFTAILQGAPAVLDNGAHAIRNGAIQMNAFFKADVRNPYTAADCPRYGWLLGGNCK
ncbi:MAG TPA: MCE family protein [Marmoricola sp.]|nr:MCE family protein [Marmoricola sp.]